MQHNALLRINHDRACTTEAARHEPGISQRGIDGRIGTGADSTTGQAAPENGFKHNANNFARILFFDNPCMFCFSRCMKIDAGFGTCLQRGAQRCPRQAPRFAAGELSTNPQPGFGFFGFGAAARPALGTPSPRESMERRAGFSLTTRTVAWANKPAFLQGWV